MVYRLFLLKRAPKNTNLYKFKDSYINRMIHREDHFYDKSV